MFSSIEQWRPVAGFDDRYEVSDHGRVRAISFMQRYTHWRTGEELFRRTKCKLLKLKKVNSGYLSAHLYRDDKCSPMLVHRLVATAFIGPPGDWITNHKNGNKQDNRPENLEWVTDSENKLHAVSIGLNTQAIRVVDPDTGIRYDSISQAAKGAHKSHRKVRATFIKEALV